MEHAGLWIATGSGAFRPEWKFSDNSEPLFNGASESGHWLAVGTAALSPIQHERSEAVARAVAAQLAKGRAKVFCAREPDSWQGYYIYPAHYDVVTNWISSGATRSLHKTGLPLDELGSNDRVVSDREFRQKLRAAVRDFESHPESRFEILACLAPEIGAETIRLKVDKVTHKHGGLQFDGKLVHTSLLMPSLRKGLLFRLTLDEVQGWQSGSNSLVVQNH